MNSIGSAHADRSCALKLFAYIAHGEQKRAQIEKMIRFADANQCRMSTLVCHFGDLADGSDGLRDLRFLRSGRLAHHSVPDGYRGGAALLRVLAALRSGEQKSTGKLHAALFPSGEMSRDAFEDVLGAMARAGLARLSDAVFEKDGKQIPYRTVRLTPAGRAADETMPIEFIMKDTAAPSIKRKRKRETPTSPKRRTGTMVEGCHNATLLYKEIREKGYREASDRSRGPGFPNPLSDGEGANIPPLPFTFLTAERVGWMFRAWRPGPRQLPTLW